MNIACEFDEIQTKIIALEQALARRQGKRAIVSRGLRFADRRMSAQDGGPRINTVTRQAPYVAGAPIAAFTALFSKERRGR